MGVTGIELFAGAGGMALGFEQAGIDGALFVDNDKESCETLRLNRPKWNVVESDVSKVSYKEYAGKVDVVSGGAPCQSFSYAGKLLGLGDIRGTLFAEFARCVRETTPKLFLFENVVGMKTHDKGRTFETVKHEFTQLGYKIQYEVLNASLYGVGQRRERLIIVGTRNDISDTVSFNYPEPDSKVTTLRDALKNVPNSVFQPYSETKQAVLSLIPAGGCWVDLPEHVAESYMGSMFNNNSGGRRGVARRLSWDKPSPTVTTSPSQKQTEFCHPDETRPLTVREYARVQSFPDDWVFSGAVGKQYKQIGNAVPVELARRLGVQIVEALS